MLESIKQMMESTSLTGLQVVILNIIGGVGLVIALAILNKFSSFILDKLKLIWSKTKEISIKIKQKIKEQIVKLSSKNKIVRFMKYRKIIIGIGTVKKTSSEIILSVTTTEMLQAIKVSMDEELDCIKILKNRKSQGCRLLKFEKEGLERLKVIEKKDKDKKIEVMDEMVSIVESLNMEYFEENFKVTYKHEY